MSEDWSLGSDGDGGAPSDFADLADLIARAEATGAHESRTPAELEEFERRRRRRKRGWIATGAVILVLAVGMGSYVGVALSAPLPTASAVMLPITVHTGPAAVIGLPAGGASAVSVTGAQEFAGTVGTKGILASSGGDKPRPIASISKIITTLVILSAKPLKAGDAGPTITFTKADHDLYDKFYVLGATIQPMPTGSRMSLHDALELMLVVSASNYAEAVSTWAFGSQANFLAATRSWLSKSGLTGTTMVDASGIDPRNASTPKDMITLGKLAMANPVVASIVGLRSTDVDGFTGLPSTNSLLRTPGVDGIKTGTLEGAGSSLLFSASIDVGAATSIRIIGVILGDPDHASAAVNAATIIDDIRAGFHSVPVVSAGDVLGTYSTVWGDKAKIVADHSGTLLTWSDTAVVATSSARQLALANSQATVGSATFSGEGGSVTVPLVLKSAITGPDAWWRITHPRELFGG